MRTANQHVWNTHAEGEADQTPTDNLVLQKHKDVVKAYGCGNRNPMRGDYIQPYRIGSQGDHREGDRIQVPGTYSVPVRQQLASSQTEY